MKIEEKYYKYADVLSPYGVESRYPNKLFLEERHAATAIKYAEKILKWVPTIIEAKETPVSDETVDESSEE